MRLLAIDIGNTRISSAIFSDGILVKRFDAPFSSEQKLASDGERIDACAISRVSRQWPELEAYLSETEHCPLFTLSASSVPFEIRYAQPEKLGADRIANMIAVRRYAKHGAIVVDLGTATHFDIVGEDGIFYGGPILAGLETMHQALSMRVPHLPKDGVIADAHALAFNTADAMNAGALFGTAGAIERITREIRLALGASLPIVLTGGNATAIADLVAADLIVPNLTLEGIDAFGALNLQKMRARQSA